MQSEPTTADTSRVGHPEEKKDEAADTTLTPCKPGLGLEVRLGLPKCRPAMAGNGSGPAFPNTGNIRRKSRKTEDHRTRDVVPEVYPDAPLKVSVF